MLFTYKNCGCCKKEMTDIKVLLNNIFPAGICDETPIFPFFSVIDEV